MAFVQVKQLLQTLKLAAFTVAFFSSFFSYSASIDYSGLNSRTPITKSFIAVICKGPTASSSVSDYGTETIQATVLSQESAYGLCQSMYLENISSLPMPFGCESTGGEWVDSRSYKRFYLDGIYCNGTQKAVNYTFYASVGIPEDASTCPPETDPSYVVPSFAQNGDIDKCYNPADIEDLIEEKNELDKNEDYCKGLILDSGNNTSDSACYSASNGSQCSVSKVVSGGLTYYEGTSNESLGCGSSDKPPFDQAGTGDDKDDCVYSDGVNYCEANKEKHCSETNGATTCDEGCIETGGIAMCDTSIHPDVGEGESDYFNDNGTCSVIAASGSKGFCEEMGGTWDTSSDYVPTSCPIGSGSCSTGASICGACADEGGVWTPDANSQTDINAINDVSGRIKDSNIKLAAIDDSTRKSGEAIVSTISSGNGKVVAALDALTKITKNGVVAAAEKEEEKNKFTTTTVDIDKTKLNALFDDSSKAALEADIAQLRADTTAFINSAKVEAVSLMSITVPNSSGYQARDLTLSQGTFDVSLNRFSDFFQALSGAVMLLCSIVAGFILLGGKD